MSAASNRVPLRGEPDDYDALLTDVGDRPFVLLGEATHGTREFYRMRATITRRLIDELGFDAVAVEADWPDALRVNRFVHGSSQDGSALDALRGFERFPQWMWRNREVSTFIEWLAERNRRGAPQAMVGFYGLDLYSLYRSAESVVRYLQRVDPEQAEIARRGYACLDHLQDAQEYGYQAAFGLRPDCRDIAVRLLTQIAVDARGGADRFHAEQDARVVVNAERYYRAMFDSRADTWNLRDTHMADTLFALREHLQAEGRAGKIVVWAHNSHVGDARATEMGRRGELNLGQLVRERTGDAGAFLCGFTTTTGWVSAAQRWDAPVEHRWVRPARVGSYEHLFSNLDEPSFYLGLPHPSVPDGLLERAIGVIYRPDTERASHYFHADLNRQFDGVIHVDETNAVEPLAAERRWHEREAPETWPTGL